MEWQKKKRERSPPRAPKHMPKHATSSKTRALAKDDEDWLFGAGPPVTVGSPSKLTCRTPSDVEVAASTSSAAPARLVPTTAAKPPASLETLLAKYPPLSVQRAAPIDDWLVEDKPNEESQS
jgi:hypothetical protein